MSLTFTKKVPDELYIDSFKDNKSVTYEYDGPAKLLLLIEKQSGSISGVLNSEDDRFNPDFYELLVLDASVHTDVAYYVYHTDIPERVFESETLIDGTTYEKIANPTLRDFYQVIFNYDKNKWDWKVVTVNPKSIRNITAERYRNFVNDNIDTIASNTALMNVATDYLATLDDFEKTGKGSIPSWKIIEARISDVPTVPQDLVAAFNSFP